MKAMEELLEKIYKVCSGCKYFDISSDGGLEKYECFNEKRWEDLGYNDEYFEEYPYEAYLTATARYNLKGEVVDAEVVDWYFDLDECKWKSAKIK